MKKNCKTCKHRTFFRPKGGSGNLNKPTNICVMYKKLIPLECMETVECEDYEEEDSNE